MLLVISPAKTQKISALRPKEFSTPTFLPEIMTLVKQLKAYDRHGLTDLMGLSEKLAETTWSRFQAFSPDFSLKNASPAILAFQGDVYLGIRAAEFSPADLHFAQEHMRIISGLYGLLKPLDLLQPYRLEMKTKVKMATTCNLYEFWGNKITEALNYDLARGGESSCLVNLASQEYFKAVRPAQLKRPVLDIVFKVRKDGQYKVIGIHAKRGRGLMVNYVIQNRLVEINDLKKFSEEGYRYSESFSSELQWTFCKG